MKESQRGELAPTQRLTNGSAGKCLLSSNLWKKQVLQDNPFNRQNMRLKEISGKPRLFVRKGQNILISK